jgi:hypothetical protein
MKMNRFKGLLSAAFVLLTVEQGISMRVLSDTEKAQAKLNGDLMLAARSGDVAKAQSFVNRGADVCRSFWSILFLKAAVESGNTKMAEYFINIFCANANLMDKFRGDATNNCCPFNAPVHEAIQLGRRDILKRIMTFVVGIDATGRYVNKLFDTQLCYMVESGRKDIVEVIMTFVIGVDPTGRCINRLFRSALSSGEEGMIKFVIDRYKPNIDARNFTGGRTALHFVVMSGKTRNVRLLVSCNADVCMVDNEGKTPLDLAIDESKKFCPRQPNVRSVYTEIAEFLRDVTPAREIPLSREKALSLGDDSAGGAEVLQKVDTVDFNDVFDSHFK